MAVKLTSRNEHLDAMRAAFRKPTECWLGFVKACQELADVATESDQYSAREKKAAIALGVVARVEGLHEDHAGRIPSSVQDTRSAGGFWLRPARGNGHAGGVRVVE